MGKRGYQPLAKGLHTGQVALIATRHGCSQTLVNEYLGVYRATVRVCLMRALRTGGAMTPDEMRAAYPKAWADVEDMVGGADALRLRGLVIAQLPGILQEIREATLIAATRVQVATRLGVTRGDAYTMLSVCRLFPDIGWRREGGGFVPTGGEA